VDRALRVRWPSVARPSRHGPSYHRAAEHSIHLPSGPLILWLVKRDDSPEIDAHGKEALNFQISMLIYNVIAAVFCLVQVGFVFLAILWVLNAVFVIIASIQASDGKFYRYPMTIRFIQ